MLKNLFACMDGEKVLYTIGFYKKHAFRVYPNGYIGKANQQEKEIAKNFAK